MQNGAKIIDKFGFKKFANNNYKNTLTESGKGLGRDGLSSTNLWFEVLTPARECQQSWQGVEDQVRQPMAF